MKERKRKSIWGERSKTINVIVKEEVNLSDTIKDKYNK